MLCSQLCFIWEKRYKLKSAMMRNVWGIVQEDSKDGASRCPLLMKSRTALTPLAIMCDNIHGALPTVGAYLKLGVQLLIGAPSYRHNWQRLRLTAVFSSLGDWADITWLQAPIQITFYYLAGPRIPGKQEHTYQEWNSKGLELTTQTHRAKTISLYGQG